MGVGVGHEGHEQGEGNEQDEQGRADAPQPSSRVRHPVDGGRSLVLVQQQRREQEPREDEEHLDAEEPTPHRRRGDVVAQHGHKGEPTKAVQGADPRPLIEGSVLSQPGCNDRT